VRIATCIALSFSALAHAQQSSANRAATATPTASQPGLVERIFRRLEPETTYSPLTQKQRLREYAYGTFGPFAILVNAASAGVSQELHSPPEWGGGMKGYANRFANNMGVFAVQGTITYALSSTLHEDNRYFASGNSGVIRRGLHAALSPFEARRRDGRVGFSYSNVTGVVGASLISRTWSPPSWRGGENIGRTIAFTFAGQAAFNLFREFLPDLLHH
jgi:hypothetical protein